MVDDPQLTKDTAVDYAWKHYKNPQVFNGDEFYEDMRLIFYIKKLLTRYRKGESKNHHLTLNHVITLNNLFGPEATRSLLRFHIPSDCHPALNSFLSFISIIPETDLDVKVDQSILDFLRKL